MIVKVNDNNTVQITCTRPEQYYLIHALINSKFHDEDFIKKFADEPGLTYTVENAKANAAAADAMLTALAI